MLVAAVAAHPGAAKCIHDAQQRAAAADKPWMEIKRCGPICHPTLVALHSRYAEYSPSLAYCTPTGMEGVANAARGGAGKHGSKHGSSKGADGARAAAGASNGHTHGAANGYKHANGNGAHTNGAARSGGYSSAAGGSAAAGSSTKLLIRVRSAPAAEPGMHRPAPSASASGRPAQTAYAKLAAAGSPVYGPGPFSTGRAAGGGPGGALHAGRPPLNGRPLPAARPPAAPAAANAAKVSPAAPPRPPAGYGRAYAHFTPTAATMPYELAYETVVRREAARAAAAADRLVLSHMPAPVGGWAVPSILDTAASMGPMSAAGYRPMAPYRPMAAPNGVSHARTLLDMAMNPYRGR